MTEDLLIENLLKRSSEKGASDLHVLPERVPTIRVQGILMPLDGMSPISSESCFGMIRKFLNDSELSQLKTDKTLDYSMVYSDKSYRINIHNLNRGAYGLVARLVPPIPSSTDEINLPVIIDSFANYRSGLVIVTGPTGNGKSTTVACIVNMINEMKAARINIIEDSIEFIHKDKKSIMVHQEVGKDCVSIQSALRSVMRQNPDVVVVGEIRDTETMSWTLNMAESGHLVIATTHSVGADATLDRIVNFFPPEHHSLVRHQLSVCLRAIISQILVRSKNMARVPACEILINNNAVRNIIRENRFNELKNIMSTSRAPNGMLNMITMAQSLDDLCFKKKEIDETLLSEIREQYDIGGVR